jgi:hypothetical protein
VIVKVFQVHRQFTYLLRTDVQLLFKKANKAFIGMLGMFVEILQYGLTLSKSYDT